MTQHPTLLPADSWIRLAWGFVILGLLGGLTLVGLTYLYGDRGWQYNFLTLSTEWFSNYSFIA